MNEIIQRRYASEILVERIAREIVREYGLAKHEWEYEDERHDALVDVCREAERRYGLDECQAAYLRQCLHDLAAPVKQ